MKSEKLVKYYVDKEYTDGIGTYSYESPIEQYYETKEEAQKECDILNECMVLEKNELYCVCEKEIEEKDESSL